MIRKWEEFLCRCFGHRWEYDQQCVRFRQCKRCKREEVILFKGFPKVGEPYTSWVPLLSSKEK